MKQLDAIKARRDALASDVAQKRSMGGWRGRAQRRFSEGCGHACMCSIVLDGGAHAARCWWLEALWAGRCAGPRVFLCSHFAQTTFSFCPYLQWRDWKARLASCWQRPGRCSSSMPFGQQTLAAQRASQLWTRRLRRQERQSSSSKQAAM